MTIPPIGLCWGTLQQASLLDLIEIAGKTGFSTITARPDRILAEIDQGIGERSLRRRLSDAGVNVTVIDALACALPGMPADADSLPIVRTDLAGCLKAAEAVSAQTLNVTHFRGRPIPSGDMAEGVSRIAREAAAAGLVIALEFMPSTGLPDLQYTHRVVQEAAEPNCTILLDTWHHARSGGETAQILELPVGSIGSIQIADRTPPPPGAEYLPMSGRDLPGEGCLPLGEWLRAACERSPSASIEVEVFSAELMALPAEEAARRTMAALARWRDGFTSAGVRD